MKYGIVRAKFIYDLEWEVNKFIEDGWEPLGGIATEGDYETGTYYQAMIFKEKNE